MDFSSPVRMRWRLTSFLGVLLLLCAVFLGTASPQAFASSQNSTRSLSSGQQRSPFQRRIHRGKWLKKTAPTNADCQKLAGSFCYSPQEMQQIYNVTPLLNAGYTGRGQTIVIIDSYGSPTIQQDLRQFDTDYHLPNPPSFVVLNPLGTVPFDSSSSDQIGWAEETTLDVEWAHALAPAANIVLLTSPVSETQGVQGMPQFLYLLQYVLDHHLGNIISQSWGTTEETLFSPSGKKILDAFDALYKRAADQHVTVFASAGDTGVSNPDVNNKNYPFQTVTFPASSPWVTAVGGTTLYADSNSNYQAETVWNEGIDSATGGGFSRYFKAPGYQKGIQSTFSALSHGNRGLPDIAYDADPFTGVPIYMSFMPELTGYFIIGGTSAGSPQWSGIVADANQKAGHSLGFLNNRLYAIGANAPFAHVAFHDVVVGNNSQGTLTGYSAQPGWDPVTGWGSPNTNNLVNALLAFS